MTRSFRDLLLAREIVAAEVNELQTEYMRINNLLTAKQGALVDIKTEIHDKLGSTPAGTVVEVASVLYEVVKTNERVFKELNPFIPKVLE